jgi:hypothetical protein
MVPRSVDCKITAMLSKPWTGNVLHATIRCARASLDDVNPPTIAKTMKNHVADIACLPAPDFIIFQENFFSAYRKNKILFYFIKKLIFL